jgi:metal-responsive CopG/Arc/MetJ family transcriptional regulator
MGSTRVTIRMDALLFRQAEDTARKLNVSRSRLFAMAMEEFLKRRKTQEIIDQLNAVYGAPPTEEDRQFVRAAEAAMARLTKDDKW